MGGWIGAWAGSAGVFEQLTNHRMSPPPPPPDPGFIVGK